MGWLGVVVQQFITVCWRSPCCQGEDGKMYGGKYVDGEAGITAFTKVVTSDLPSVPHARQSRAGLTSTRLSAYSYNEFLRSRIEFLRT